MAVSARAHIFADNGSKFFFRGDVNPNWQNSLMTELKSAPASSFTAVDESGCQVSADSAAFAYGTTCPAP